MLKLLSLSITQSLFLVASQILLKIAISRMESFSFTWKFFKSAIMNWSLACSGISIVVASLIWFYILKHFEFSVAYPLISISYIFGMLASIYIFHEIVPVTRWIGVFLIMSGVFFITR
ncbi:MAG: EamA family transporter [Parabacteroides sp.]|nr:EamA family transporter [Parabacteroides sp.]